jgi:hypothetical protein
MIAKNRDNPRSENVNPESVVYDDFCSLSECLIVILRMTPLLLWHTKLSIVTKVVRREQSDD